MPIKYYPGNIYPSFIGGPAYVMSGESTKRLVDTIDNYSGNFLDLEDLFITGIISEISSVERHHSDSFKLIGCNNVCPLHGSIAVFMCKDINQMKRFWNKWIKSNPKRCLNKNLK